jgi:hypothetical protein
MDLCSPRGWLRWELNDERERSQCISYVPEDASWQTGNYLATLQRQEGKPQIEGKLRALKIIECSDHK